MSAYNPRNGIKVERRKHVRIRDIFDEACQVASPLLSASDEMGGVHSGNMLHLALHDAFPTLHKQDVPILMAALSRVFGDKTRAMRPNGGQ